MTILTSIILILGFIVIYAFFIQIYSVLFRIAGLSREKARFQAISMLTSVGFTTKESELVTSNPQRRRIAIACMITSYVFSVVIVSSVFNLLVRFDKDELFESILLIGIAVGIFIVVLIVFNIPYIRDRIDLLIERIALDAMSKKSKDNVVTLLETYDNSSAICEININWLPEIFYNKSIIESKIKENYKLNILVLRRKNKFLDVTKDTIFQKGDQLVVFGNYQMILDIFLCKSKDLEELIEKEDLSQNQFDLINNYGAEAMVDITINQVPEFLKEKSLFESGLKENYQINLLAIKRSGIPVLINKNTMIEQDDIITVFGDYKVIKKAFIVEAKEK